MLTNLKTALSARGVRQLNLALSLKIDATLQGGGNAAPLSPPKSGAEPVAIPEFGCTFAVVSAKTAIPGFSFCLKFFLL